MKTPRTEALAALMMLAPAGECNGAEDLISDETARAGVRCSLARLSNAAGAARASRLLETCARIMRDEI